VAISPTQPTVDTGITSVMSGRQRGEWNFVLGKQKGERGF
jgi:hypothetical protein